MLEEVCAASTEDSKRFVSSKESDLTKLLLESVVSTSPPSLAVSESSDCCLHAIEVVEFEMIFFLFC